MIICLTGMHRSGTSLMSSYFEKCGINMGENMVGAMRGNTRGHFEDTSFVDFHEGLLSENSCHMYSPKNPLNLSEERIKQAKNIIKNKQLNSASFGWKDPRSTLFLQFWSNLLPECKFVLLYRDPYSVIDSLRRRGTDRRIKVFPWLPASAWLKYNQSIIKFHKENPDNSIVINISGFNNSHEQARLELSRCLNYDFEVPYTDVFHKDEIASETAQPSNLINKFLDYYYSNKLTAVYNQLESIATINNKNI